jgi:type IV secretory pathway component VirB8
MVRFYKKHETKSKNTSSEHYVSQVSYEFYRSTPQFFNEAVRIPIFGLRVEL